MTVKEVSESFKCDERTVQRVVKELYPKIVENGKTTILNEKQVTAIKLKLEKNYSLDNVDELPKTRLEKKLLVVQAMMILNEEVEELRKENEILKPKALIYDSFISAKNWQTMNEVAKVLGIGRNKLFEFLRNHRVLMSNNIPYQPYMDMKEEDKYFKVIEKPINMGDKTINKTQLLISPCGIKYLKNILEIYVDDIK